MRADFSGDLPGRHVRFSVGSCFEWRSFRGPSPAILIDMINLDRFQETYWKGWDLYEGDVALIGHKDGPSLTGKGWEKERCLLIERKFLDQTKTVGQTWWRIEA
jgi:hypothetical protein